MICKNCGQQIQEGAQFCRICGASLAPSIEPSETAIKSSSNTLTRWLIVAGVGLWVAIIVTAIILLLKPKTPNMANLTATPVPEQPAYNNWETNYTQMVDNANRYYNNGNYAEAKTEYNKALAQIPTTDTSDRRNTVERQIAICDILINAEEQPYNTRETDYNQLLKDANGAPTDTEMLSQSSAKHNGQSYYASTKAFFYNEPEDSAKRKTYLVEGDVTEIVEMKNGFGCTSFTNAQGQTTIGWVKMNELHVNAFVGDWAPDDGVDPVGDTITFKADGTFDTGDDSWAKGRYTILDHTLLLSGKTGREADDVEEREYKRTMIIREKSLVGYKKINH